MASNWSNTFLNQNGEKRMSPLLLVFIALQLLIIIAVAANIFTINNSEADDDLTIYKKLPELTINNLAEKVPFLKESKVTDIQKKVFKIVSENTSNIDTEIKANIRDNSLHTHSFTEKINYFSMIIDIPSLEQSYEVFYGDNAVLNPDISTFVLCIKDDANVIYKNFNCKSSDKESIRETIVSSYMPYFKFELFSAYIDPKDPSTIHIKPSVTYVNDEATKTKYINEVRSSIESLGIPADNYKYHVRTTSDFDYHIH